MKHALMLGGLVAIMTLTATQSGARQQTGTVFPKFTSKTTDGKTFSNANIKGKVAVFDFWATWCGPCKELSPSIQALHKKYASKGVVIVGANLEGNDALKDDLKAAADYKKKHKYTFTFTAGNNDLAGKLGVQGIPRIVVVGKNGKIVADFTGLMSNPEKVIGAAIDKALKG